MNIFEKKPNGMYVAKRQFSADDVLHLATDLVSERFRRGDPMSSPEATRQFLIMNLMERRNEVFGVMFLDSQHRLLSMEELFQGTIDTTSVYPRVVVERCLHVSAAAVILYHNHPSGEPEPSSADRHITNRLVESLGLIDVRVLDHFVIAGAKSISFAERGWL